MKKPDALVEHVRLLRVCVGSSVSDLAMFEVTANGLGDAFDPPDFEVQEQHQEGPSPG